MQVKRTGERSLLVRGEEPDEKKGITSREVVGLPRSLSSLVQFKTRQDRGKKSKGEIAPSLGGEGGRQVKHGPRSKGKRGTFLPRGRQD